MTAYLSFALLVLGLRRDDARVSAIWSCVQSCLVWMWTYIMMVYFDHQVLWPSCTSTIIYFDYHLLWPSCTLTIIYFDHHSLWPSFNLTIMYVLSIMWVDHHACCSSCCHHEEDYSVIITITSAIHKGLLDFEVNQPPNRYTMRNYISSVSSSI